MIYCIYLNVRVVNETFFLREPQKKHELASSIIYGRPMNNYHIYLNPDNADRYSSLCRKLLKNTIGIIILDGEYPDISTIPLISIIVL